MKYFLTLMMAMLFVLPASTFAQTDLQAELEDRVKERTERQRQLRAEQREKRDQLRTRMEERRTAQQEAMKERRERNQERIKAFKDRSQARERTNRDPNNERARALREQSRERAKRSDQTRRTLVSCPDDAFLGIESSSVSREKADKLGFDNYYGSYVTKVINNSAAHNAGLQPFDYVYGINDDLTSDNDDLTDLLNNYESGDEVTVHYVRNNQKKSVKVALGNREDAKWDQGHKEKAFLGISHKSSFGENQDGVMVSVVSNSTAESLGLKNGDVITAINGNRILDWDDVTTAIENITPGEAVKVNYVRDGQQKSGSQTIKSYRENKEQSWADTKPKPEPAPKARYEPKKEAHEYAFLGIYSENVSMEKAKKLGCDNPYGSYVTGVIPSTAAAKAGIQKMDYLYGVDEYRVGKDQRFTGILKKFHPGDQAVIHLFRKGEATKANVTFGSRNSVKETEEKEKEDKNNKCKDAFFGISSAAQKSSKGVSINVVKNSTAKEIGIQNGDAILTINGYVMTDWDDIGSAIDMLTPGENIKVTYLRDGRQGSASGKIKSYAEAKNCKDCDCNDYNYAYEEKKDHHEYKIEKADAWVRPTEEGRVDLDDISLNISNMTKEECAVLNADGTNAIQINALPVEDFSLEAVEDIGLFELEFDLPNSGFTMVRVYNKSGRVIYDYELGNFSGEFKDNIDLAQNGTGEYFLHILQGNKSLSKKIELSDD